MRLPIPTAFSIFGSRWTIEYRPDFLETEGRDGACYPAQHKIVLQDPSVLVYTPVENVEQSFTHELVHAIAEELREDELNKNEKLVELIGLALHQALTTMEYEREDGTDQGHRENRF